MAFIIPTQDQFNQLTAQEYKEPIVDESSSRGNVRGQLANTESSQDKAEGGL